MVHAIAIRTLIVWLWFGALSAIVGGAFGVLAGGAGAAPGYLQQAPLASHLIPALLLGVIIGGTQLVGAILLHRRHTLGLVAALIAGFGMIVWIFVEVAMLSEFSPLQVVYVALGTGEIGLVVLLFGLPGTLRSPISEPVIRPWTPEEQ